MPYEQEIQAVAQKYGLPANLLTAVVKQESGFNPNARSPAGAMGLMQLMGPTAKSLGVTNPYDPVQSLEGGAKYLRQQLDKFGSIPLALAAYNAGPGNVEKYGGIPPFKETQNYVKSITSMYGGGDIGTGVPTELPNIDTSPVNISDHRNTLLKALNVFGGDNSSPSLFGQQQQKSPVWKQVYEQYTGFKVPETTGQYSDKTTNALMQALLEKRMSGMGGTGSMNTGGLPLNTSIGSSNAAINTALSAIGTDYKYGGNDLKKGIDCSGLTKIAYSSMGIEIPRTAAEQYRKAPIKIDNVNEMRPGDLVFFGDKSNPSHVGLYIGNGQMIEAPRTGKKVRIASINRDNLIGGGRYIS